MRYITGGITLVLAISLGGPATAAGTQTAQPQSMYAPSALVLTVGKGADAATSTVKRAVTLSCTPTPTPTGTHPDPAGACTELRTVKGNFDKVTRAPSDRICTKEWNPIVVTAEGVWEGRRVSYEHTFPNPCEMRDGKGKIFAF